ncbi:MAG: VOC family protein [Hyphomicrobiaceae bacterium]|nr:VOC family protein [Hyphomicrobiaceae bacterium]
MEPRLSLVTLGVADVARARDFYERMGFVASPASNDGVAFFRAGGVVLALFGRGPLAADAGVADDGPCAFTGVALAHNVASEPEVDAALAAAAAAGGRIVKSAQRAFWGGWSGYFADPDGHLWEVAHNPAFPLDASGGIVLP